MTKEQQEQQDQVASEEKLGLKVNLEPLVKPDLLDFKELLEHQETQEPSVVLDQLDLLDHVVQQALQVLQDHKVLLEM